MSNTKSIVTSYYDTWTKGSFESSKARALLADNLNFRGSMEKHDTADGFLEGLGRFLPVLKEYRPGRLVVDGDEAYAYYECELATGNVMRLAEYFKVADGKISEIKLVFDTADLPKM